MDSITEILQGLNSANRDSSIESLHVRLNGLQEIDPNREITLTDYFGWQEIEIDALVSSLRFILHNDPSANNRASVAEMLGIIGSRP